MRVIIQTMQYLMKKLWEYDKKTCGTMILHIIIGVIVPFIGVVLPSAIISLLLHHVSLSVFARTIAVILLFYGIAVGIYSFFKSYHAYAFIEIRQLLLGMDVFKHRSHLDYALLEDDKTSVILEDALTAIECNNDGAEGMYHTFIEFAIACIGLLVYALCSSGLNIALTACLFILVIVEYACFVYARNYEFSHKDELNECAIRSRYLNDLAFDTSAAKDIRLYQLQDWIDEKYKNTNRCIAHIKQKDYGAYMAVDVISILLDVLRDIACYGFLIYKLMHGLPIDQFVFYLGIISGFSLWFKQIGETVSKLSSDGMIVHRMLHALHLKNKAHHGDGMRLDKGDMTITFDHVSFRYPNQDHAVLDDVSFTIHAKEKVALVGMNGAGKTTIVKLILGFYLPTSGAVYINGIDTKELDIDDLFQHISGIFQDSCIISYTIAENVSMQDLETTDLDRVKECIKLAGLWDKVQTLPLQERTYLHKDIDEDGIQLSGGQIQKLFMARMLYHDAYCVLLDEPSAALDAIAESELYETYLSFMQDKTTLFISHRLNSTKFCDHIVVLDQGEIVEEGTHETLLDLHGIYAEMFQAQSKYYQEEGEVNEGVA